MLKRPVGRRLSKTQVRRFLKRDEGGVASTVGTIMALLVFLTFLTLFTNSYIPIWMVDNERSHMNEVVDQFGSLKGKSDMMMVNFMINGQSNLNMYQTITLGANGIPVFASATAGLLTYAPSSSNSSVNVNFNYSIPGSSVLVPITPGGKGDIGGGIVQLYAPNRYYVQQWIGYENGAILIKQYDGQAMKAFPNLMITKTDKNISLAWTQVNLVGSNASAAGTGSAGLNLNLIYLDSQIYNTSVEGTVVFTFASQYYNAWWDYLNSTLTSKEKNLIKGVDYDLWPAKAPTLPSMPNSAPVPITLILKNVHIFTYSRASIQMTVQVS